jgi:hypothetical protein
MTSSSHYNLALLSSSVEFLEVISATPLATMDPETSTHHARASQGIGSSVESSADMESAILETSGGSWDPCNLDDDIFSSMEQEGLIATREISKWWVEPNAATPVPLKKEIVMLKSHINRGLSLLPSYFLKSMLCHYRLQLHHIAQNSLTIIAGFVALCEFTPAETYSVCTSTSTITGTEMEIFATADLSNLFCVAENHTDT